jgi:hypothetical protein
MSFHKIEYFKLNTLIKTKEKSISVSPQPIKIKRPETTWPINCSAYAPLNYLRLKKKILPLEADVLAKIQNNNF